MVRYKAAGYTGVDGLVFPELLVKFSSGYLLPLHLREGEYLPTEILDSEDVKKSLLVGSLRNYIKQGNIVVEDPDAVMPEIQQISTFAPPTEAPAVVRQVPSLENPVEVKKVDLPVLAPAVEEQPQMTLVQVKTPEDFSKLSYFLKLRFIKECKDKEFLKQVMAKLDGSSKQLLNNLQLRVSQLP